MRFKKKRPESGTRRIRGGFAFLPVTINGDTRWLECVTYEVRCAHWEGAFSKRDMGWSWERVRWIDKE